jgi:hypothetical protein
MREHINHRFANSTSEIPLPTNLLLPPKPYHNMALPSFNHPAMQAEPIVHQSIDSFIGAHAEMTTDQWSQASSSNNTTKYTVFDDNIVAFDSLEFGMRSAIDYDYGLALKELERDLSDSDMAFMAKWVSAYFSKYDQNCH